MRRLPWHVVIAADRRAMLTALGVALAVAFTLASTSVPAALRAEVIATDGPFARADAIIARSDGARFDPATAGQPHATAAFLAQGVLEDGRTATFLALEGPRAPPIEPDVARPGLEAPPVPGRIIITHPAAADLAHGAPIDDPLVARSWYYLHPATLRALDPGRDGADYLLIPWADVADPDALRAHGFSVGPAPGVSPFLHASAGEVARDILFVVAFASVLAAVFSYEFLRSEAHERRRDMGLWRAVGLRSRELAMLLVARAAAITMVGFLGGAAITFVALGILREATGSDVFAFHLPLPTLAFLAGAFLLASVVGASVPAAAAARKPVSALLEAAA